MKGARPLFWHQGLFLQPQHFQLLDQYLGSIISPVLEYGQPYFWGVAKLNIQEAALGMKQLDVLEGEFIFPDGTFIVYPGNTVLRPRSFDDAWKEGEKPFRVFLGLRKWNPISSNVTVVPTEDELPGATTRFATTADPEDIPDLHGTGPKAQIKQLRHMVRIFWEEELESLDNYSFVPIAQLERSGDTIHLSHNFVPPCVTVASSPYMTRMLRDIRDQVASRCNQLEEYKDPREVQAMTLALYALNRQVPMLNQLCETQNVHPWWVYSTLRQIVGEISTFSQITNASGESRGGGKALPPYDHNNLGSCFSSVHELIGRLLEAILAGPEHQIRMEYDGIYYSGTMPRGAFERHHAHWLVVQTGADPDMVQNGIVHVSKLGSINSLTTLIARAIPGIPLMHHPGTPPGLPQRPNTLYFKVNTSSHLWADVLETENISLYWDTAPKDMRVEIIILES